MAVVFCQGDRDIDSLRDFAQRPIGSDGKAEMLPQGTARIIHKFVIYLHAGMATIEVILCGMHLMDVS